MRTPGNVAAKQQVFFGSNFWCMFL
jgi:hypothetical protein